MKELDNKLEELERTLKSDSEQLQILNAKAEQLQRDIIATQGAIFHISRIKMQLELKNEPKVDDTKYIGEKA